ncbi:MAG: DUF4239 domain-containing protein [Bdellovibrionales bacterium]|nr:DUF4239 domain-containing protein [Bdellovibrionales bacterium]
MQSELLYGLPLGLVLLAYVVILALTIFAGHRQGRRVHEAGSAESLLEMIPTSLLGLLALLMGFTFSMAIARFDARRLALVNEANAISTVWTQAGLLPKLEAATTRTLLRQYLDHRIAFPKDSASSEELRAYQQESQRLEGLIWIMAQSESERDRSQVTALFTSSVTRMMDQAALRIFALQDHVPEITYLTIFLITVACIYSLSYIYGCRRHHPYPLFLLALLLCMVLGLIQDLDRPARGIVNVNSQLLSDLKDTLNAKHPVSL